MQAINRQHQGKIGNTENGTMELNSAAKVPLTISQQLTPAAAYLYLDLLVSYSSFTFPGIIAVFSCSRRYHNKPLSKSFAVAVPVALLIAALFDADVQRLGTRTEDNRHHASACASVNARGIWFSSSR